MRPRGLLTCALPGLSFRAEAAEARTALTESSAKSLRAEVAALTRENGRLATDLEGIRRSTCPRSELDAERRRAREAESALQAAREELSRRRNTVLALQREKTRTEEQLVQHTTHAGEAQVLQEELRSKEEEIGSLKVKVSQLKARAASLEAALETALSGAQDGGAGVRPSTARSLASAADPAQQLASVKELRR